MRVIVTGCTGFIGSHLTERLIGNGHEVIGLSTGWRMDYLQSVMDSPNFKHVACDLKAAYLKPYFDDVDCVIHCAARAGMANAWTHFQEYLEANVLITQRLLQAAKDTKTPRFLYLSSSSVYGRYATGDEGSPLMPVNPYGVTKLAGEHICKAYEANGGPKVTIIRPFSIYGPRQRADMAHHIFIKAMLEGRPITVNGDGFQRRSNTYVADLVNGITMALENPAGIGKTFNIGGDKSVSLNETIALIEQALNVKAKIIYGPREVGDQTETSADCTRAQMLLGYMPQWQLADGIAKQVEWQRGRALVSCS